MAISIIDAELPELFYCRTCRQITIQTFRCGEYVLCAIANLLEFVICSSIIEVSRNCHCDEIRRHFFGGRVRVRKGILALLALCGVAASAFAAARTAPRDIVKITRCIFRVDGTIYIFGVCKYIYSQNRIEFSQKRTRNYYRYFGFIDYRNLSKTVGEGTWNGPDIHSMHGDNSIGLLRRHGACWKNRRASLCEIPPASAHSSD